MEPEVNLIGLVEITAFIRQDIPNSSDDKKVRNVSRNFCDSLMRWRMQLKLVCYCPKCSCRPIECRCPQFNIIENGKKYSWMPDGAAAGWRFTRASILAITSGQLGRIHPRTAARTRRFIAYLDGQTEL